ncbi:MAG: hypothetical protein HY985_05750 [Magnetospirillum sp.]|nr:hypothetical protein [Magnetospirillum sp.]
MDNLAHSSRFSLRKKPQRFGQFHGDAVLGAQGAQDMAALDVGNGFRRLVDLLGKLLGIERTLTPFY